MLKVTKTRISPKSSSKQSERRKELTTNELSKEHGSFTPVIFSAYAGYSPETDRYMKELGKNLPKSYILI